MNILSRNEFEKLTEKQAQQMALKVIALNGFVAYIGEDYNGSFIEMNCNVYYNSKMIKYIAYPDYVVDIKNDIKKYSRYILKQLKIKTFTLRQLKNIKDYEDYNNKRDYIFNIMPQLFDSISIFSSKSDLQEKGINANDYKYRGCITHLFKNKDEANILNETLIDIEKLYNKVIYNDINKFENAVICEMFNHETPIDWDGWTPALNALGIKYEKCDNEHKEAIQRAYKYVCKSCNW